MMAFFLLQTATPSVREAFVEAQDLLQLIFPLMVFAILVSIMFPFFAPRTTRQSAGYASKSQTKSKPLLKPLARWLYDHTLGAVIARKQYHYRTFGDGAFVRETEHEIATCVHCDGSGDGFLIAFGREWVALGFVVWRRQEGSVRVCESCEVANRQEVMIA